MERHKRTIFKTLSWRLIATSTTLVLAYIFTQNIVISASISLTEIVVKTAIYYMHERMWAKTDFGRKKADPSVLITSGLNNFPIAEIEKRENRQ